MQDAERGHEVSLSGQNSTYFIIYELYIFLIFHFIFSDYDFPWVTETLERKTMDKENHCNIE